MSIQNHLSSATILVTGGAGAIGSHVVHKLSSSNEVIVIDNMSSGSSSFLPKRNVQLHIFDIRDTEKLNALFKSTKIDLVIHLAAHFANQNSVDFPSTDLNVNILGTLALLELCRDYGCKFVYASSSCVYGQKTGQLSESALVDDLHTPYAISKYSAELYTKFYSDHYSVPCISLRFFNSFGPYEKPGPYRNVIPNFIAKALRGEKLVITGTGNETRDFTYVENTVNAILLAADTCLRKYTNYNVFNVGTGQYTKILDLAEKIKGLTDSNSEIEITGQRRNWDHTKSRCANIDAVSQSLGYKVNVSIDEGLSRTVSWFKDNPTVWL